MVLDNFKDKVSVNKFSLSSKVKDAAGFSNC